VSPLARNQETQETTDSGTSFEGRSTTRKNDRATMGIPQAIEGERRDCAPDAANGRRRGRRGVLGSSLITRGETLNAVAAKRRWNGGRRLVFWPRRRDVERGIAPCGTSARRFTRGERAVTGAATTRRGSTNRMSFLIRTARGDASGKQEQRQFTRDIPRAEQTDPHDPKKIAETKPRRKCAERPRRDMMS